MSKKGQTDQTCAKTESESHIQSKIKRFILIFKFPWHYHLSQTVLFGLWVLCIVFVNKSEGILPIALDFVF